MKKLPFGFASPLILLAVGLIVGIAITFAYFQFKSKPAHQNQPSSIPQSTPASTPNPDASREPNGSAETANWKTYTNKEHGFSFKYPEKVYIKATNEDNLPLVYLSTKPIEIPQAYGGALTEVEIRTSSLLSEKTAEERAENLKPTLKTETIVEKKISIPTAGIEISGIFKEYPGVESTNYRAIILQSKNEIIEFGYITRDPAFTESLLNQILSTFQFIN